jgi:transposase, IS6 family
VRRAIPKPPNASRVKALHATACSAPQACPVEEQGVQPAGPANPTTSAPRVIHVEKNAASPKAMAELKAAGILSEQVELTSASNTSIT